jgi:Fe-Mn family superoxide dismutase
MRSISRRKAVSALVASGAGLAIGSLSEASIVNAEEQTTVPRAFLGQHQPQPLPFNPAKLKGLSEKLIRSHWENNYGGSVKALNAVEQRLNAMVKEKELPAYIYGDLKREELLRTGSVVLHEHYFGNLGGDGKAGGEVLDIIKQWFGSYEQWESEFKKTAGALSGGSGWAILTYNFYNGDIHNYWAWDHMHNAPTGQPLLVLDMYEHSYQMDYGAAAAKYIDTFMDNVNWEEVNRRLVKAQKASAALRA